MNPFLTRERFGRPQFLAGMLLLCFFAQSAWLVRQEQHGNPDTLPADFTRVEAGWRQWHGKGIAGAPYPPSEFDDSKPAAFPSRPAIEEGFDREHSPLQSLVSSAPLLAWPAHVWPEIFVRIFPWLTHLPFLVVGVLLGASLWYVARRLCGNNGGLVALTLYCFSPAMIQSAALWHTGPEVLAVWGAFGTIFTAIAVAHTLYAPREVILWNWRRILLLGISLAIAIGSQFSMIIVVPMALGFLLYVAPVRRGAGFIIWIAACVVGFVFLFATYFFHPHIFWQALHHAEFWGATLRGFTVWGVYKQVAIEMLRACPAFAMMLPVALAKYLLWPRARYFGNTAPLAVAITFLILGMAHPHAAGEGFFLGAVPFLLIFVSGILADLMETRHRALVTAGVVGLVAANVIFSVMELLRAPQG